MTYRFWTSVDQEGLNTLNTTNYRAVVGVRLATWCVVVAMGSYIYEIIREPHGEAMAILQAVLIFVGAMAGLGVLQFGAKRFSDTGMVAAKNQPGTQVLATGDKTTVVGGTSERPAVVAGASAPASTAPTAVGSSSGKAYGGDDD